MSQNFSIVKRGYAPEEVDSYIAALEQKLNEYREKSSAINKAIINAQIAADNIIRDAHIQTEKIFNDAKNEAQKLKQSTIAQIGGLKTNITNQKRFLREFQADYDNMIKKYLSPITTSTTDEIFSKLDKIEALIDDLSNPASNENKPAAQAAPKPKEPAQQAAPKPQSIPTAPEIASPAAANEAVSEPNEPSVSVIDNSEPSSTVLTPEEAQTLLS